LLFGIEQKRKTNDLLRDVDVDRDLERIEIKRIQVLKSNKSRMRKDIIYGKKLRMNIIKVGNYVMIRNVETIPDMKKIVAEIQSIYASVVKGSKKSIFFFLHIFKV